MKNTSEDFISIEKLFVESANAKAGINSKEYFYDWFKSVNSKNQYTVIRKSLNNLNGWQIEEETGNIVHTSGKFFRIEGIRVETNFGITREWTQPIINQPEIGILGFIVMKKNGILHFLVQAKMEPGNINMLQISPTVQATKSNYTQVHGGKKPLFLEYFINRENSLLIVDQLQSEQGSRFLAKRNRNMIVLLPESKNLSLPDNYCWLTLGQIFDLLKFDNIVNMDSRTVLSSIRFSSRDGLLDPNSDGNLTETFEQDVYYSTLSIDKWSINTFSELISWITEMKTIYELKVSKIPLNNLDGWELTDSIVRHKENKFFSVLGVSVLASNREVASWDQPLIDSLSGGVICFICQKKNNLLHFLVQARVEPGNFDILELAPTLQCTPENYVGKKEEEHPPYYNLIINSEDYKIRYESMQSEEGGRFYHDQNKYLAVEIDSDYELEIYDNYNWMTIGQMKEFIRFNNYFNIEARGLISCLDIKIEVNKQGD